MRHPSGRAFSAFFAWVLAAVPVFAAGPAAPPNPVAPGPGDFTAAQQAMVDDAISRARSVVEDMEGLASGGLDGSNCPKTVGVQDISADYKAHKFSKGIEGEVHRLIGKDPDHWEMANACLAYARKDPAICDGMLATDHDVDPPDMSAHPQDFMRGRCRLLSAILPVYRAYDVKDPGYVEACVGLAPLFDGLTSPAALRKACQAAAAYRGDPEPFIAAYSAALNPMPSRDEALAGLQKLTGDQSLCAAYPYGVQREVCAERADLRKAAAIGRSAACKGVLCRVMMGDAPYRCENYAADVKKAVCRVAYLPSYVDDRTRVFQGLSDQVVGALSNAGLGDLAALKDVNTRLDKIFALRARLDEAANRLAPKPLPASTAAKKK